MKTNQQQPSGKARHNANIASLWRLVRPDTNHLVVLNDSESGTPLFCIHEISGDVMSYCDFARALGPEQRVYGIQVPKSKMNAAFAESIELMAQRYVDMIVGIYPKGAILLAGWSVGAIIALEMAQRLRAMGQHVPVLIALDGAPYNTGAGFKRWNPLYTLKLVHNLQYWIKHEVRRSVSVKDFIKIVADKISYRITVNTLPSEQAWCGNEVPRVATKAGWSNEQIAFMRALNSAARAYVPKTYSGWVISYEASIQPLDHLPQIGAAWTKIAPLSETVLIEGKHETLMTESVLGNVIKHLRIRLAELLPMTGEGDIATRFHPMAPGAEPE